MPSYQSTPFKNPPPLLVAGTPQYCWGSFDDKSSPTFGYITSDSAVTTTATVTFQIVSGNAPVVGEKITVRGAGRSANFNVTNGTILTVSTNMDTGVCTVTYTISSTSLGTAADAGQVEVPRQEVGETFANGASIAVAAPFNNPVIQEGRVITATVTFPTVASTGVVYLQGALVDLDEQYEDLGIVNALGSLSSANGPSLSIADLAYRFYRFRNVGVTGTGTVVAKIEC